MNQERCPNCGKFCGVVYRWRGPSKSEVPSCTSCGLNVPMCAHEDGTVKGCRNDATHEGAFQENHIDRYWCEEHRPESAEQLPYVEKKTEREKHPVERMSELYKENKAIYDEMGELE